MTINGIKRANRKAGRFFFSSGAIKFFNSFCKEETYPCKEGTFFITSEKCGEMPRAYTVRFTVDGSKIERIGKFYKFNTVKEAIYAAKKARDEKMED